MEELPWWLPARTCLQCRRPGFSSWVGKIPYWKEWLPTPIFLPGVFHGRRRPAGCSRWGHEESDMTERLTHSHTKTIENSTYVYYFYKIRFSEVSKFYHIISLCVCGARAHTHTLSHVWLCGSMDGRPPGSSVHGIIQARIHECVAVSYSRGSSSPRDQNCLLCLLPWQADFLSLVPPGKLYILWC